MHYTAAYSGRLCVKRPSATGSLGNSISPSFNLIKNKVKKECLLFFRSLRTVLIDVVKISFKKV